MNAIDPAAAIARANSVTRWHGVGLCLNFVDWTMGEPTSRLGDNGGPANGAWQEAKDGWYYSRHQHAGDMNPPAGVPCYWETGPSGNPAGHIVISLGDGWCRTTDYAGAASVSTQTIASITVARRGGYLGWTEDYGGNPIAGITNGDDMYDDTAREELIGSRIDKTIIPLLKLILSNQGNDDAQVERILDAMRRESRPRVIQINQPGSKQHTRAAAIDVDEGYFRSYGSAAELENDKRLSLVAPELLQVTEAEFTDLEQRAAARLEQLVAAGASQS